MPEGRHNLLFLLQYVTRRWDYFLSPCLLDFFGFVSHFSDSDLRTRAKSRTDQSKQIVSRSFMQSLGISLAIQLPAEPWEQRLSRPTVLCKRLSCRGRRAGKGGRSKQQLLTCTAFCRT